MIEMHWIAGISLGLLANVSADVILALDLHKPWREIDDVSRCRRVLRWVGCMLGHVGMVLAGASLSMLFLFALFSISAATDFETSLLPPDWFLYGSVIITLILAALSGGWPALRDVAVAQAFCFAVVTLGVAFFDLCDSGDIKLAMQFGGLCGSLGAVAANAFGVWLAAILLVLITFVHALLSMPAQNAIQHVMRRRPPQGPLMWCGFLFATWLANGILTR